MSNFTDDASNDGSGLTGADGREQDRHLPIANIIRIMKKALPKNAKVAKDAKDTISDCVSEFISFITMEASEKCQSEKRKTINGEDIIQAMENLGFDLYIQPLKLFLEKYRETERINNSTKKQQKKLSSSSNQIGSGDIDQDENLDDQDDQQLHQIQQIQFDQQQSQQIQHQHQDSNIDDMQQLLQQQQQQQQLLHTPQDIYGDENRFHILQQQQQMQQQILHQQIHQQQQQQQQQFENQFHPHDPNH